MNLETFLFGSILGFALSTTARIIVSDDVPLIGPSFLSNFDMSNSKFIGNAKTALPDLVDKLFESGDLDRKDLAFTIDVYSAATNDTIFSYSHVGEKSKETLTSGELNDNTISRIGSVTKLFTVYSIIAQAGMGVFSDPITKYLPELKKNSSSNPLDSVRWEDITVGALAAQQAGTGGING
jgi:CubicO group peptidase (beta-lactamase class C family)